MTYDEWLKTERQHNDLSVVENAFGYVPGSVKTVVSYDPGVAVILENGDWFSHVATAEACGQADGVRRFLWEQHAQHEVAND